MPDPSIRIDESAFRSYLSLMLLRKLTPLYFLCLLLGGITLMADSPANKDDFSYPELENPLNILVPQSIRHLSHSWGIGYVRVRIDTEGNVEDWIPIRLPHVELFDAVDRTLDHAVFIPATELGEPVRTEVTLRIPFDKVGHYGVLTETVTEHIESRQAAMNPQRYELALSSPELLDEPVRLLETGPTFQVRDESGTYLHGTVEVMLYIDHKGHPHLVRASPGSPEALRKAAVLSVSGFQFSKPTRNGRPTIVKARIPVIIGGGG